ncbi:unnamed protein product [Phytomonas sp. Hart1]|nr:unnamed protein product [Phytomonas sp. Hart1]|eukprot:CCW72336.1 unnamed protein product [Phytomonas sp. isolate Hart1]
MELGQATRPRSAVAPFSDFEPRAKCAGCCGLRGAALVAGPVFLLTVASNAIILGGRLGEGRGWRGFCDRNLFLALPLAAVVGTHHWVLSEALWSKHRKSVWAINWQSSLTNLSAWGLGTAVATWVSRRVLPGRSRAYRMWMWDYYRTRRGCANPWCPTLFGRLSADLDWYNVVWTLSLYHLVWAMVTMMLEKQLGAQYAMFFRDSRYSKWCSPRWREWREVVVCTKLHTDHKVAKWRWGTFLTNNKWYTRSQ